METDEIFTEEEVNQIIQHWTTSMDTCRDEPFPLKLVWPCDPEECKDAFGESMVVPVVRNLPDNVANEAREYIAVLVSIYPFQLRAEMARPMWHRFLTRWNDTGNRQKSLRWI